MRRLLLPALTVVGVGLLTVTVAKQDSVEEKRAIPMPPPIDNWLSESAEKDNKTRRKAWFKEIHKAPPGVDWKAVEKENGLNQLRRRNTFAATPWSDPFGGEWVERGSHNQAGRMMVARHSTDGSQIYAGSSLGGVWKGSPDGTGWTPIGDNIYGGAHWLETTPGEGEGAVDVVLAATDWGLIHYSEDDGETWVVPEGIPENLWWMRRVLKTSDGSHTLFLVLLNTSYQGFVMRSTDGGRSFETVLELGRYYGDLWTPRDGDNRLYVVSNDEILVSDDLGDSWEVQGSFPSMMNTEGAELAGSEAGAPRLWAVTDDDSLLRSDDAGASWTNLGRISDYWGALTASILDEDVFAWGGVEMHYTSDGGETDRVVNTWDEYYGDPINKLHADLMGMDVLPTEDGGEVWYIPTDGGLYHSLDTLRTVENLSVTGLRVSQYYGTLTDSTDGTHIAAGSQDQGYQVTNTMEQTRTALDFEQIISGDYAHLVSTGGTHDFVYSVYPGFMLVQEGADPIRNLHYVYFPNDTMAWLPPLAADPEDPESVFLVGQSIHRYTRTSQWVWSSEVWSDEKLVTGPYDYVSALVFSPVNPDRAYAASNNGSLFWSDDRGRTWTRSETTGNTPQYFYGHAMVASSLDEDEVLVGGSGYGGTSIYRSTDGGRTFAPFDDGIPETLVYSLGEAPDGSGVYVAGTETSAWRRDPGDGGWTDITGDSAPLTIYWSVEALAHENTMRFGTYGRGIWDYQLDPGNTDCWPVVDDDGDGVDCLSDCADNDASVLPGAPDVCDGVDVNCDLTDPDETDSDGDGVIGCEDCDDANAEVAPGLVEICGDGLDNDCSGGDAVCAEETTEPKGCGCTSSPGTPLGALWGLLGIGLLGWRRR